MPLRTTQAIVLTLSAALAGACAKDAGDTPPSSPAQSTPAAALSRIEDPSLVCMVNDAYMGKAQIPVEVDGKTYFGCCAMCEERLAKEPGTRVATDPVTGETVDKATAVLAQDANGVVHYFANAENLSRYRPTP